MVLDASAIIAILAREPDAQRYANAIDAAKRGHERGCSKSYAKPKAAKNQILI